MKGKILKVVVVFLLLGVVGSFCGCGSNMETKQQDNDIPMITNEKKDSEGNSEEEFQKNDQKEMTGENLISTADLSGSVIELKEDGCSLAQTMLEGEEIAYESAEGHDSENQVNVIYEEGTVFQSATIDINSGHVLELTDINKDDIKKQSRLLLFGDFQDTYTFKATKVVSYYLQ